MLLISNEITVVKNMHHGFYETFGEWVYNSWHPEVKAEITTDVESMGADPNNDYVLTAYDKKDVKAIQQYNRINPRTPKQFKPIAYIAFKARMSHSIATFFLLALIFATPNDWKRKVLGGIAAVYILYILIAMKLTFLMSMADGHKTSDDGVWFVLSGILGNNESCQELYYILLLTIWILVSISKTSISKIVGVDSAEKT